MCEFSQKVWRKQFFTEKYRHHSHWLVLHFPRMFLKKWKGFQLLVFHGLFLILLLVQILSLKNNWSPSEYFIRFFTSLSSLFNFSDVSVNAQTRFWLTIRYIRSLKFSDVKWINCLMVFDLFYDLAPTNIFTCPLGNQANGTLKIEFSQLICRS